MTRRPLRLAFLMPSDGELTNLRAINRRLANLREDQLEHFEHLLRSWRIFGAVGQAGLALTRRALQRTLRDRP